jgi:fatty acid synthase
MQRVAKVTISSADLLTEESARNLLTEAESLGPVGGIFHLAMVLGDALLENQSAEKFHEVCGSKVQGTIYLDKLSRLSCPQLDHFVCFSSVAAGRGNPGQANYGFANSSMERICEARKRDGLPGIAIQWGAIGDVGVVAEMMGGNDVVIGGSVPQRMPSCLDVLDKVLNLDLPVYSSIVPADTKRSLGDGSEDLLKVVCHVLGVKDADSLSDDTTLGDLGMDSLMAVEIRQGLERDYDVIMSATEVRQLRVGQIREMSDKRKNKSTDSSAAPEVKFQFELPPEPFKKLNSSSNGKVILFFPSIDGNFSPSMTQILSNVVRPVVGVNWTKECDSLTSIADLGKHFAQLIRSYYLLETEFDIMGHSFGCLLALETAVQLQEMVGVQAIKKLLLIDGSPESLRRQFDAITASDKLQAMTEVVSQAVTMDYMQLRERLSQTPEETRLPAMIDLLKKESDIEVEADILKAAVVRHQAKIALIHSKSAGKRFAGSVKLIRPTSCVAAFTGKSVRVPDDYHISSAMTDGDCTVVQIESDSANLMQCQQDVAAQIDAFYRHVVFA